VSEPLTRSIEPASASRKSCGTPAAASNGRALALDLRSRSGAKVFRPGTLSWTGLRSNTPHRRAPCASRLRRLRRAVARAGRRA
jgi:hypothetical protein